MIEFNQTILPAVYLSSCSHSVPIIDLDCPCFMASGDPDAIKKSNDAMQFAMQMITATATGHYFEVDNGLAKVIVTPEQRRDYARQHYRWPVAPATKPLKTPRSPFKAR